MTQIKVSLLSANSLMPQSLSPSCDPFVILKLGTQKYISSTKRGINVKWNEGFIFNLTDTTLHVEVYDKDRIKIGRADKLAAEAIDLAPLLSELPQQVSVKVNQGYLNIAIDNPATAGHFGNTQRPQEILQTTTQQPSQTQTMTSSGKQKFGATNWTHGPGTTQYAPTKLVQKHEFDKRPIRNQLNFGSKFNKNDLKQSVNHNASIFQAPPSEIDNDYVPPVNVPEGETLTNTEKEEIEKRWARFVSYMAKPYNYDSKYKRKLQTLDAMGAINLERVKREQIPPVTINYCCALFFNPYEDLPHTLEEGPVNDAIAMAELFLSRGFTVVYVCDATPKEYYIWMNWLLENVEKEFVSYFSGHGTQIKDKTGKEEDGLSEVLVFYNEKTKFKNTGHSSDRIDAVQGITNETVEDTVMFDLIAGKDYPNTRIVLLTDCCHSGTMFNMDQVPDNGHLLTPPLNVVCVGSAKDSQTAKQTVLEGKESGVFTHNFCQLLKQKPLASFHDLQTHMNKQIKKYQTIQLTSSSARLFNDPIIANCPIHEHVKFAHEVTTQDTGGIPPTAITDTPEVDEQSEVEKQEAKKRWDAFIAEMKKPANYNSKYKKQLQELDSLGAINLERVKKTQMPTTFMIYNAACLFFCPYEDLPHTLDLGPVNDAIEYAKLFIERGYTVCYICDATPHEYYKWMDWLLENVEDELITVFSGHGTQIPDKTGREADGLSEVMVFYDVTRKKRATGTTVPKIEPVQGITNETVEDTVMYDLISSKDYPNTRIVCLTDCCHSGSMFNMEESVGANGQPITPPFNCVCVGSAQDNQTAKQTMLGGKEIGVFTYNFTKLLREKPQTTFNELKTYMDKQIKKYQSIVLSGSSSSLYNDPILID
ncbi:putative metacaspase-1 [Blattamonas nauphoetae]|uniref:Metacaspase-1 n=1 Tax=Blattamonas nauphoetae TaxID=2049346 RepID=A0ABQ9XEL4_9EUKA|nr:putative metacaspase-1 [Blattamonas nauphoetae]